MSAIEHDPVGPANDEPTEEPHDSDEHRPGSELADRIASIEQRPLAERADGFAGLHDELRTRLDTGGSGA